MFKRIIDKKKKVDFIFHPHNITGYKINNGRNFRIIFSDTSLDVDRVWEITNLGDEDLKKLTNLIHSITMNKIDNDRFYVINSYLRLIQKVSSYYIKFMTFYNGENNSSDEDLINLDMDNIFAMFHYDTEDAFPHMNRLQILIASGCYRIDFHPDGIKNLINKEISQYIEETITIGE